LGVFAQRGQYQLYCNVVEPVGEGAMAKELAARKLRLEKDGLLDPRRKRPLPKFPAVVGVATSLSGAAIRDFLKVSGERYPAARILIANCTVQGENAAPSVVRALDLLIEDRRSDVIVVTRGGGSKEDLMAFQDEQLARFIAMSPIPVVSAVGHEIDTTIADLVADGVAPTPSAAALMVLPDGNALIQRVDETANALTRSMTRRLKDQGERIRALQARLRHPGDRLKLLDKRCADLQDRLHRAMTRRIEQQRSRSESVQGRLHSLSPLAVLDRGYAIVNHSAGIVTDPAKVTTGDALLVRVAKGTFGAVAD
jgi:exodeoxyribonuclease VII large subunit